MDLNSDVGEGFGRWTLGDDDALLAVVTSANVACGFHAGDPGTIRRVCRTARERGVAVGAQVGYRDLAGFGRRFVDVAPDELADDVLYQVAAVDGIARTEGTRVTYVKPHGALYHACVADSGQAGAVATATAAYASTQPLAILGPPGSALLELATAAGLTAVPEAFADRRYTADGGLVPRGTPGAVLTSADEVVVQAVAIATRGQVTTVGGTAVDVSAQSLCVHGDTPGAGELARRVRDGLVAAGVAVEAFAR